jgi:acetylornithine deacetylase/succinyl-diaminopimelate desuccinylase-like protein
MTALPTSTLGALAKVSDLLNNGSVKAAVNQAKAEQDVRVAQQIRITETPAAPFHEEARGRLIAELFSEAGLPDVRIDEVGNVIGRYKGTGCGPVLVVGAHLDTVFPEGTPIKVREENGVYYAPGISDDAAGLASVLQVIRSLVTNKVQTQGDIVFAATVGEEGNGDLRGSKHLWAQVNDYDGMIAVDSASPTRILKGGVGCKRYRIIFEGAGGHSLHKFGIVGNAIQGIARFIHKLDEIEVPAEPRCTFNVGTIKGGTSVNAIAERCELELDIRSYEQKALEAFTSRILPLVEESVEEENAYWNLPEEGKLRASIVQIGDRPAGVNPDDSPVIEASLAAMDILGIPLQKYTFGATDQNVPLAMGLPATTQGAGGAEDFNHSVKELWRSEGAYLGPQLTLLTAVALVGVAGGPDPMLSKRAK